MTLRYVHPSEVEDFETTLRRLGRADDFEASDSPTEIVAPGGHIGPAVNGVVVRCRKTGVERSYSSGSSNSMNGMPAWVNDVAADIQSGVFDVKS